MHPHYPVPVTLSARETTLGAEYSKAINAIPALFGNWADLTSRAVRVSEPTFGKSYKLENSERNPGQDTPQLNLLGHRVVKSLQPLSGSDTFMSEVTNDADFWLEQKEVTEWSEGFTYGLENETDTD